MEYEIVQMKLTSGNEVVCQVLEWPEKGSNQMIARNALAIVNIEFDESNDRMYMFVPWLHFAEGEKDYVMINTDHIMASSKPTDYLIDQYKIAVYETNSYSKKRVEEHAKRKEEGLKKLERAIKNKLEDEDVNGNVVRFPASDNDSGTVH